MADFLPTEIYIEIFKYLRVPELMKCRAVCRRWKEIIDEVTNSKEYWHRSCKTDFKAYDTARRRRAQMPLEHLYRSLYLWSKLICAEEERDEFCYASAVREEILGFALLSNDVIGVHKRSAIVYYNVETLRPLRRNPLFGGFEKYAENDDVILTQDSHLRTYIIPKGTEKEPIIFESVKNYILLDHTLFFVDTSDNIFAWGIKDGLPKRCLGLCQEGILSLGYSNNQLHILTYERCLYSLNGDKLKPVLSIDESSNLVDILHRYNMLSTIDWKLFFRWLFLLNHSLPEGLLQDIITMREYGDVFFVGTSWGVLRIYYKPFSSGKFDIFNSKPVKQYNFMETNDCPVLTMCQIIDIDCRENVDGHTVFVVMPKKIAVLKYRHIFKTLSQKQQQLIEMQPMQIMNVH